MWRVANAQITWRSSTHARREIENRRREYNEERPKRALGGPTPAAYAKQLQ
ncbi:integrase core domain-containing protein [Luteibacter sp. Lutesp34]|uniref:integrase core domain-containing protein n=1 Tax=Luteibacter sp. Lutesp34 TaxID=3243030 RepID=UPI0039B6605B